MVNCGTGQDYTVNEYYAAVKKAANWDGEFTYNMSKPVGMTRKLSDVSRLRQLGYENHYTMEEGVQHAYDFFKTHHQPSIV